jgi:dynein heavy chain 1
LGYFPESGYFSITRKILVIIVAKLPMENYRKCFCLIEKYYEHVANYVQEWVRYQALWDIETSSVYDILGVDLSKWQKAIIQIKKQRSTFDTSKTSMTFIGVEVDFESVQQKVAAKYDQWQRDLLSKYSSITYTRSVTFLQRLKDARQCLESSVGSLTSDIVNFIIIFKKLQHNKDGWKNEIDLLEKGQKLLDKNRFH